MGFIGGFISVLGAELLLSGFAYPIAVGVDARDTALRLLQLLAQTLLLALGVLQLGLESVHLALALLQLLLQGGRLLACSFRIRLFSGFGLVGFHYQSIVGDRRVCHVVVGGVEWMLDNGYYLQAIMWDKGS